jgi:hypothetical protein
MSPARRVETLSRGAVGYQSTFEPSYELPVIAPSDGHRLRLPEARALIDAGNGPAGQAHLRLLPRRAAARRLAETRQGPNPLGLPPRPWRLSSVLLGHEKNGIAAGLFTMSHTQGVLNAADS